MDKYEKVSAIDQGLVILFPVSHEAIGSGFLVLRLNPTDFFLSLYSSNYIASYLLSEKFNNAGLSSQHDKSCHLKGRFRKKEYEQLWTRQGFTIRRSTYRVCFLFPLIALVRLVKKVTFLFSLYPKSDVKMPSRALNRLFLAIQRAEHALLERGYPLPFGSSIFMLVSLPKQEE